MDTETVVYFKPGEIIFKQGDPGNCMYFIREGTVEVTKEKTHGNAGEDSVVVATLRAGGYQSPPIGEMALVLPDGKRTATVRAISQVVAERTSKEGFNALLHAAPPTLQEIVTVLIRRLADTTQQVVAKS